MATCLVTGGAGFLGSHLCDHLLARGHRVICVDNLETGTLQNISHIRDGENFRFVQADITEHYEVDEPVDFVFHMASPASPIDYARLPLHTLKVGAYGTHNTLGLAKAKRARFLLASTSEVYGDPQVHPQQETYWGNVNPIGPRGVYDEAKRYAEALTMAYLRQQGVDTAIVRIFNTYGPRMRPNDGRAIPTFLRQALTDKPLTVFGDGSPDALLLLRRRPDPRPGRAGRVGRARAGEHRQPGRDDAARDGQARDRADRVALRDRLRGAARRRPARSASPTSRARATCSAGSPRSSCARACASTIEHAMPGARQTCVFDEQLRGQESRGDQQGDRPPQRDCEFPAVAVAMNPFEVERLGWDTIRGLPIRADPNLGTGAFTIVCGGERARGDRGGRGGRRRDRPGRPLSRGTPQHHR